MLTVSCFARAAAARRVTPPLGGLCLTDCVNLVTSATFTAVWAARPGIRPLRGFALRIRSPPKGERRERTRSDSTDLRAREMDSPHAGRSMDGISCLGLKGEIVLAIDSVESLGVARLH